MTVPCLKSRNEGCKSPLERNTAALKYFTPAAKKWESSSSLGTVRKKNLRKWGRKKYAFQIPESDVRSPVRNRRRERAKSRRNVVCALVLLILLSMLILPCFHLESFISYPDVTSRLAGNEWTRLFKMQLGFSFA